MSARAPDRAEVAAKLIAALRIHGVVIKLLTGRMVVQQHNGSNAAVAGPVGGTGLCYWQWYGNTAIVAERAVYLSLEAVAAAVLDQCGTRAVLAALEGEGG